MKLELLLSSRSVPTCDASRIQSLKATDGIHKEILVCTGEGRGVLDNIMKIVVFQL